ncbi:unnamed protein product [marine sediment metagenome]|uniref:Uncharacterized protein n=1 Tax=marine sediment metagenome TaxID=412755 RepID=X1LD77_9ZZZZ
MIPKKWKRHVFKFLLGYLVWTIFLMVYYGTLVLLIPGLIGILIAYGIGTVIFWITKKIIVPFFRYIQVQHEYKRWRKKKEGESRIVEWDDRKNEK